MAKEDYEPEDILEMAMSGAEAEAQRLDVDEDKLKEVYMDNLPLLLSLNSEEDQDSNHFYSSGQLRTSLDNINSKYEAVSEFKDDNTSMPEAALEIDGITNDLLVFFNIVSEINEGKLEDLLIKNIVDEDFESNKTKKFISRSLSSYSKEQLAMRSGIISGETRSYIESVRQYRNDLIHEVQDHHNLPKRESVYENVWEALMALNRLSDKNEQSIFFWADFLEEPPEDIQQMQKKFQDSV